MKGYKVVVITYYHTCDDTFTEELSGVVHGSREAARKELVRAKNNIEFNNEFTALTIVEC